MPWRNGGGTTRDLLAWPDPAAWRLRISVAAIERDGPFSDFIGIERWFAVLQGSGVALQLGSVRREVRRGAPPLRFDGALAPMCWLLDGPTSDLNLLVRRDAGTAAMQDAAPGCDWTSDAAWRALLSAGAAELVVDDRAVAATRGTALLWSAQAAQQRWQMRPRSGTMARGWWIEFRPHAGGAA
ncbi:MAG TPA: HutD family protein [Burkholderiaceae bacterium]|nr:HutD family protein [Burkholderiaceae bacterium]